MTEVEVVDEVLVNRPVEVVWAAIIDPAVHAAWHPYVTEIRGEHREGAVRTCSVSVGRKPGRTDERCVELVPERSIAWLIEDDSSDFGGKVSDWRFRLQPEAAGRRHPGHGPEHIRAAQRRCAPAASDRP